MDIMKATPMLILFLAGCGTTGSGKFERARVATEAQTELIGMSKKDLYLCAGVPVRQEQVEGLEFLAYSSGGDSTGVAISNGGSPNMAVLSSHRRYCEVT